MVKLNLKNISTNKKGKVGQYSDAEKQELLDLDTNSNTSLHLRALASKWNRSFENVRRTYYRLHTAKKILVDKELAKKQSTIPMFTLSKNKENVSKFNRHINGWSEEEDKLVLDRMAKADYKRKESIRLGKELGRTSHAVANRYYYLLKTTKEVVNIEEPKLDTSFIGIPKEPSFIPETKPNLFIEEVQVTMYKAIDGSLHEKAGNAVKANIRAIIDSIPDKDATDMEMHTWFFENQEKINYMLNTNPNELW